MSTPDVSVVVPTWNRADRLARLLPHLQALAESDRIEVVIVDDGSTDHTPSVLAGAVWAHTITQANRGAAGARNTGWRAAQAPVVAFLDDDCVPADGWPLALLDRLEPGVDGVGGRIRGAGGSALDAFIEVERLVDHGKDTAEGVDYLITANAVFRVAALAAVDGFDEAFPGAAGEDVDLSWRIRDHGGRLARGDALVLHDHRTSLGEVLRTYRGHGRARALLEARHPGRTSQPAAAGRALALSTWRERRRGYRALGVGVATSWLLLDLRAAGLVAFAWGLREGRRSAASAAA